MNGVAQIAALRNAADALLDLDLTALAGLEVTGLLAELEVQLRRLDGSMPGCWRR